jgi:hypothetical protein
MRYYHLSPDRAITCIRYSSVERSADVVAPRIPECCATEDRQTKRVCVAPSIWQCVLSILRKCLLHIYVLDAPSVTDPLPNPDGSIDDFEKTGEKWITDKDIEIAGGEIVMKCLGFVNHSNEVEWGLRRKVGMPIVVERGSDNAIWQVHNGEWLMRKTGA